MYHLANEALLKDTYVAGNEERRMCSDPLCSIAATLVPETSLCHGSFMLASKFACTDCESSRSYYRMLYAPYSEASVLPVATCHLL